MLYQTLYNHQHHSNVRWQEKKTHLFVIHIRNAPGRIFPEMVQGDVEQLLEAIAEYCERSNVNVVLLSGLVPGV